MKSGFFVMNIKGCSYPRLESRTGMANSFFEEYLDTIGIKHLPVYTRTSLIKMGMLYLSARSIIDKIHALRVPLSVR